MLVLYLLLVFKKKYLIFGKSVKLCLKFLEKCKCRTPPPAKRHLAHVLFWLTIFFFLHKHCCGLVTVPLSPCSAFQGWGHSGCPRNWCLPLGSACLRTPTVKQTAGGRVREPNESKRSSSHTRPSLSQRRAAVSNWVENRGHTPYQPSLYPRLRPSEQITPVQRGERTETDSREGSGDVWDIL